MKSGEREDGVCVRVCAAVRIGGAGLCVATAVPVRAACGDFARNAMFVGRSDGLSGTAHA